MSFLETLLSTVFTQLVAGFGVFFVCGGILSFLQQKTHNQYYRSVGWKGILWTGWIGTPIHELSHVFFAWLFRHRIEHISLFRPDEETGQLGHVSHSYERWSLFQRLGNFFIGAAPLLIGPIVLFALLMYFVPHADTVFAPFTNGPITAATVIPDMLAMLRALFVHTAWQWQFAVFLYASFCVVSHMAPSNADLKGMWQGFTILAGILLIVNAGLLLFDITLLPKPEDVQQYGGILLSLFTYAISFSLLHLLFATVLLLPFRK